MYASQTQRKLFKTNSITIFYGKKHTPTKKPAEIYYHFTSTIPDSEHEAHRIIKY